jgi:hypothetical protein
MRVVFRTSHVEVRLMKRIALLTLPLLATIAVVALGFFLFRTQGAALKPRIEEAREAVTEAIGEVAEAIEEAVG